MFTGIIEDTGRILATKPLQGEAIRMTLEAPTIARGVAIGDSVAVNGCCLTVVEIDGDSLSFDLLAETVRCTSILAVGKGALVNLERSVPVGGRMGGHFVAGHIDGMGTVKSIEREKDDITIRVVAPEEIRKYIVYKGSIAIDGISLTVAGVDKDSFHVCLIPHTLSVTNLKERRAGDKVNLESDILARYIEGIYAAGR
jgi:riboflavin synthase